MNTKGVLQGLVLLLVLMSAAAVESCYPAACVMAGAAFLLCWVSDGLRPRRRRRARR